MLLSIIGCSLIIIGCGGASSPPASVDQADTATTTEAASVAERHDRVYVCNCGEGCDCGTVAVAPGTCSCGTELAPAHLVKVEETEGLLCTCGEDCTCTIDADDESKCSCGREIRRVSFEGTGLYYCKCGGSCTCNYVSATPGQCSCGMELTASS